MKESNIVNTTTTQQAKGFASTRNRIADLNQTRLPSEVTVKKSKGFIGADEPGLHEMHSPVSLPGMKPELAPDLMRKDFTELVQGSKLASQLTKGTAVAGGFVKQAQEASTDIFEHIGSLGKNLAQKATTNKTATTTIAALGAVYAGILSIKNLVSGVEKFSNPKADENVSWVVYGLQALLQGGLALGLAAPFLGMKSLFNQVINGQNIVQMRLIIGAILAPMLLGIGIKVAQGVSILNKLPFIGQPLGQIFRTVSQATREVTISPEANSVNHLGAQAPGMPNYAMGA